MPTYEWQCNCGLRFDGYAKMADRTKPKACPSCGEKAPLAPPSKVAGHFTKTVSGPVPQNTGIQGLDAHIDRTIGQSAAQGRAVIEERNRVKRQVLDANPGKKVADLSRNPDGSYRVLGEKEAAIHKRSQAIQDARTKHIKRKRSR